MGAQQSFPVPTEQDFTKKAIPKSSTTATSPLCQAFSTDSATATTDGIRLTLPPHAWDTKQDKHGTTVTYIPELNIKLVASVVPEQNNKDNNNNPMLLVQNAHDKDDDTILAVLVQPLRYPRPIQICTPHKPNNSGAKLVVRNYQGQNFYEYATVDKIRDSKQHLMRIPTSTNGNDNGNALLWRTDKCGKQGVLRDYIIHAVNSIHQQHGNKTKTSTNDLLLGAYLQEQAKDSFTMRIAASNYHDPLLMVCFALAIERWQARDLEFLRQASTIKSHSTGGRGFLKHVS